MGLLDNLLIGKLASSIQLEVLKAATTMAKRDKNCRKSWNCIKQKLKARALW
jgi:hypothetical protein